MLIFAAVFPPVGVAFGVEFAEDAGGAFPDVVAEDFVLCYLEGRESISVMVERNCHMPEFGCRS